MRSITDTPRLAGFGRPARVEPTDLGRLRAIVRDTDPRISVQDRMPLLEPLQPLLGGLRRGAVVAVDGDAGRTSLAMALLAGVSMAGGWCGVVGMPSWGCLAAAGYGVRLDRLALVPEPGAAWAEVVAALAGGMDAVLVRPPAPVPGRLARRLAAKARQSRCTLLTLGRVWEGCDTRVSARGMEGVGSGAWEGLGAGRGRLRGRRVTVVASTRPGAELHLWLPGEDGGLHDAGAVGAGATHDVDAPAGDARILLERVGA
jgi:hypothetical protein